MQRAAKITVANAMFCEECIILTRGQFEFHLVLHLLHEFNLTHVAYLPFPRLTLALVSLCFHLQPANNYSR